MNINETSIAKFPDIRISRRTFLKVAVAVPAMSAKAPFSNNTDVSSFGDTHSDCRIPQIIDEAENETEIEKLKAEILDYRKQLGFTTLPKDFIEAEKLANTEWKLPDRPIANNLPDGLKSYGEFTDHALKAIYGKNHLSQFLQSIEFVDSLTHFATYHPSSKSNQYGLGMFDFNLEEFTDYLLHESAGHAFDPSFHYETMPFETYAQMAHGRWRMLTQAMSVEDQFFNHPNDSTYPKLLRHTGEEAARHVVLEADASQICDIPSRSKLLKILLQIREQVPAHQGQIYFNNKVSHMFGTLLRDEDVQLEGQTRIIFEHEMEMALVEIYAEMIKYVIRYPEKLGNNTEIAGGYAEVISAVRGEAFAPEDIAHIDLTVPQEVTDSWVEGQKQLKDNLEEEKNAQIALAKKNLDRYNLFYSNNNNILSDLYVTTAKEESINQTGKNLISKYIEYCSDMYHTFGEQLYSTTYQFLTPQFDPENLHAWTIRDIVHAVDTLFVETLLSNILDRQFQNIDWEELSRKKEILEWYRNTHNIESRFLG